MFFVGAPPLLLGRCLCVGGRYAQLMPPEMSSRFLEATVNGLQENQPSCIRISAVKAIYWFCEISCADANNPTNNIIRSHLPNIFQGLFNLSSQASTEVLILVMETFQTVISVNTIAKYLPYSYIYFFYSVTIHFKIRLNFTAGQSIYCFCRK